VLPSIGGPVRDGSWVSLWAAVSVGSSPNTGEVISPGLVAASTETCSRVNFGPRVVRTCAACPVAVKRSMNALEVVSCEFALRPDDPDDELHAPTAAGAQERTVALNYFKLVPGFVAEKKNAVGFGGRVHSLKNRCATLQSEPYTRGRISVRRAEKILFSSTRMMEKGSRKKSRTVLCGFSSPSSRSFNPQRQVSPRAGM
jgi:hypothetical protein